MAKPKHPTVQSLRQGQTVYMVCDDSLMYDEYWPKYVRGFLLYSHNEPDPDPACEVKNVSVPYLKAVIKHGIVGSQSFYYSRRRAEAKCR